MNRPSMPVLRLARASDHEAMERVMTASARHLGAAFYDARQNASFVLHVAKVDGQLVDDGTYFVAAHDDEITACGGWSRRDKLFTGNEVAAGGARWLDPKTEPARVRAMFVAPSWARRGLGRQILEACEEAARADGFLRVELMATLPGVPLYRAAGYSADGAVRRRPSDGVSLPCIRMHKAL